MIQNGNSEKSNLKVLRDSLVATAIDLLESNERADHELALKIYSTLQSYDSLVASDFSTNHQL